jgi:ribosomal 50S subunit-recycling heat shock protein
MSADRSPQSAAMHHTVHGAAQSQANIRLDSFLSEVRLIKRRAQAKIACEEGKVLLDGKVAKAGKEVKVGQIITINFANRTIEVEVVGIPSGNVRKAEAKNFYRVIREVKIKDELL